MESHGAQPYQPESARDKEMQNKLQNKLLSVLVDLTTTKVLLGILILSLLGLALVAVSFQLSPAGRPESFGSFVIRSVGMGLLVTALTSAFLQLLISRARQRFEGELNQFLQSDVTNELEQIHRSLDQLIVGRRVFGLVAFHSTTRNGRFDIGEVFRLLKPGDELLWLETYVATYREFQSHMEEALRSGVRLRMLVIDPDCDNARFRAEEIDRRGFSPRSFSRDVREFREWIQDIALRLVEDVPAIQQACRVRAYSTLPGIPMYIIVRDGLPFRGFNSFFLSEPTAYFVHLEWERTPDGFLESMHKHFERKWSYHAADEYALFAATTGERGERRAQ